MPKYIECETARDMLYEADAITMKGVAILNQMPDADVRPVVRGEFERDGHHIRCLLCGTYWCETDREGDVFPRNFCPNCGGGYERRKDGRCLYV